MIIVTIKEILSWILKPGIVSSILLLLTLIFIILTFNFAQRPYVGIVKTQTSIIGTDLNAQIIIENTGNVPANKVKTNIKLKVNNKVLTDIKGVSEFVLFPAQTTSGKQQFHNINDAFLNKNIIQIDAVITYQQKICPLYTRKYKTQQLLQYSHQNTNFMIIKGFLK